MKAPQDPRPGVPGLQQQQQCGQPPGQQRREHALWELRGEGPLHSVLSGCLSVHMYTCVCVCVCVRAHTCTWDLSLETRGAVWVAHCETLSKSLPAPGLQFPFSEVKPTI